MGRVISLENISRERIKQLRFVVYIIRRLVNKAEIDVETRDLAAQLAITLFVVWGMVNTTVEPWEKRGYWIKADRYRMDWSWTRKLGMDLRLAVLGDDWVRVAQLIGLIAEKVGDIKLSLRYKPDLSWNGAHQRLVSQQFTDYE
mgnify:FL=1